MAKSPTHPGREYGVGYTASGAPYIQSAQTGNFWLVAWDTLIKQALSEGLDNELEELTPVILDPTGRPYPRSKRDAPP